MNSKPAWDKALHRSGGKRNGAVFTYWVTPTVPCSVSRKGTERWTERSLVVEYPTKWQLPHFVAAIGDMPQALMEVEMNDHNGNPGTIPPEEFDQDRVWYTGGMVVAAETGLSARTAQNVRKGLKDDGLVKAFPDKDEFGAVKRWNVGRTQAPRDGLPPFQATQKP